MFVGDALGRINYYRNDGNASDAAWTLVTYSYHSIDVGSWFAAPAFVDMDSDGDYDLFIGEWDGNINYYRNEGDATSAVWILVTEHYNGIDVGQASFPAFVDIDGDGDFDLFAGEQAGGLLFWRNMGSPPPVDTIAPTTVAAALNADGTTYTFDTHTSQDVAILFACVDAGADSPSGCNETRFCTATASCVPSMLYSSPIAIMTEGTAFVCFRSDDLAGNVEEVHCEQVHIDQTPPDTTITSAVDAEGTPVENGGPTLSNAIAFTFAGTDNVGVAGFECNLDGAAFTPCTSSTSYSALAAGNHSFQVQATDTADNTDPTPANFTWTILTQLHVESIGMSKVSDRKPYLHAEAVVTILDNYGSAVDGATVAGVFTGDSNDSGLTVATDASGQATFLSSSIKKGANWTFCVENVSKPGSTYNPSANVETCDSTGEPGPSSGYMHVGDLYGGSSPGRKAGTWNAKVIITIHDESEDPVAKARVTGTWSNGAKGPSTCTTSIEGQCSVTKKNLRESVNGAAFTVDTVTHATLTYQMADNHDPDGCTTDECDSITTLKP